MLLGPISLLDCLVFLLFLAPQLLWHAGPVLLVRCAFDILPFLLTTLPYGFLRERYVLPPEKRSPFVYQATAFEDLVVRLTRWAFANLDPRVGRVFFSRQVALPFQRFRMLRHGHWRSPVHWHEYEDKHVKGVWVIKDPTRRPDLVIYYIHGGGFIFGSSYFYLEFLMTWLTMLIDAAAAANHPNPAYRNPAIFSLEYSLVPEATFPTQFHQAVMGYLHVLSMVDDSKRVVFSGDSAGGNLILSVLLRLQGGGGADGNGKGRQNGNGHGNGSQREEEGEETGAGGSRVNYEKMPTPGMAALISPWVKLVSAKHRNTSSDYLDVAALHRYGLQYAGRDVSPDNWTVSPASCRDARLWRRAVPTGGLFILFGDEEVFAPEIKDLVGFLRDEGLDADCRGRPAEIHAWPVAALFLSNTPQKRTAGIKILVDEIVARVGPADEGAHEQNGLNGQNGRLNGVRV